MTPSRDHGRGSFILDRRFPPPIGRLKVASGTTHRPTFDALDAMLTTLKVQGRWDILEGIQTRRLKPLYVLSLFRQNRLDKLPGADELPPWYPLAEAWAQAQPGKHHRAAALGMFRRLRDATPELVRLGQLPDALAAVRLTWTASSWNHVRDYVRGFLRDQVEIHHPLYRAVVAQRSRPQKARQRGRARSLEEVAAVLDALARGKSGGLVAEMFWTLCATGMRPEEYWRNDWLVEPDRVAIVSAKKDDTHRAVPAWTPLTRPILSVGQFRARLRNVGADIVLYDARRSFARWCEEAGVIETNIKAYMGHGPKTVTDLYTMGELPGQLKADAAKLAAYAGRLAQRVRLA